MSREAYAEAQGRGTRPAPDVTKAPAKPEVAPPDAYGVYGGYRTAQVVRVVHRWSEAAEAPRLPAHGVITT
eukprot:scaffold22067_cov24-Phaeocystis_antarctica.AAC.1